MATCTVGTYTKETLGAKADLTLGNLSWRSAASTASRQPTCRRSATRASSTSNRRCSTTCRSASRCDCAGSTSCCRRASCRSASTASRTSPRSTTTASAAPSPTSPPPTSAWRRCSATLFEKIAGTLTFWTPDQETSFESEWVDTFDAVTDDGRQVDDRTIARRIEPGRVGDRHRRRACRRPRPRSTPAPTTTSTRRWRPWPPGRGRCRGAAPGASGTTVRSPWRWPPLASIWIPATEVVIGRVGTAARRASDSCPAATSPSSTPGRTRAIAISIRSTGRGWCVAATGCVSRTSRCRILGA